MFDTLIQNLISNPLNWILLFVLSYSTALVLKPRRPPPVTQSHPGLMIPLLKKLEVIELRNFTRKELSVYNGQDNPKIYIAIKGLVFDVTPSAHFYGSGDFRFNLMIRGSLWDLCRQRCIYWVR